MGYKETYRGLSHGTDEISAKSILADGFELRGDDDSWCGKGIYFYDIKKKAWWAANRKCSEIKKETGNLVKPTVLFADILDIDDERILDLRAHQDLCDFEEYIKPLFGEYKFKIAGLENSNDEIIKFRSILISYYSDKNNKKLIVGNFRQRPQPKYEHAIEFSNSLDMIFGIETIYCVKDRDIIQNVYEGGKANEK